MVKKSIDIEAVRRVDAQLARFLEEHPELREPNADREQALRDWLEEQRKKDNDDVTTDPL